MSNSILRHNIKVTDPSEHFSTLWLSHATARTNGTFTDLLLVPGKGQETVLVHCSVFLPLFPHLTRLTEEVTVKWKESPVVLLPDVELETLQRMVKIIYTGRCEISSLEQKSEMEELLGCLGLHMPPGRLTVEVQEVTVVSSFVSREGPSITKVKSEEGIPDNNSRTFINEDVLSSVLAWKSTSPVRKPPRPSASESTSSARKPPRPSHQAKPPSISYSCNICGRVFRNQMNLTIHMKSHQRIEEIEHKPEGEYICPKCLKRFRNHINLTLHLITHTINNKPFICLSCAKNFKFKRHLVQHTKFKHPWVSTTDPLFEPKLKVNEKKTENDKREVTYKCELCDFEAESKRRLSVHLKRHMISFRDVQKSKKVNVDEEVDFPISNFEDDVGGQEKTVEQAKAGKRKNRGRPKKIPVNARQVDEDEDTEKYMNMVRMGSIESEDIMSKTISILVKRLVNEKYSMKQASCCMLGRKGAKRKVGKAEIKSPDLFN